MHNISLSISLFISLSAAPSRGSCAARARYTAIQVKSAESVKHRVSAQETLTMMPLYAQPGAQRANKVFLEGVARMRMGNRVGRPASNPLQANPNQCGCGWTYKSLPEYAIRRAWLPSAGISSIRKRQFLCPEATLHDPPD